MGVSRTYSRTNHANPKVRQDVSIDAKGKGRAAVRFYNHGEMGLSLLSGGEAKYT